MGDTGQQTGGFEVALGAADGRLHHLAMAEMLKDRDEIGKAFVEAEDVRPARLAKMGAQTVEQRMRDLVRDDVVRQTGENDAAWQGPPVRVRHGAEVAKAQFAGRLVVERVLTLEGMRQDA